VDLRSPRDGVVVQQQLQVQLLWHGAVDELDEAQEWRRFRQDRAIPRAAWEAVLGVPDHPGCAVRAAGGDPGPGPLPDTAPAVPSLLGIAENNAWPVLSLRAEPLPARSTAMRFGLEINLTEDFAARRPEYPRWRAPPVTCWIRESRK
jgi:hypothetical protein